MNEIIIVKDSKNSKYDSIYLNGILLECLRSFNFSIHANEHNKVILELLVDRISYKEQKEDKDCIVIQGKKYRLVPYEQWIEPISDSIPF